MKRMIVDRGQCTGCESCVLTCSFAHFDVFALEGSRIQIDRNEEQGAFAPGVCQQCSGRFCVETCPVNALSIDPDLGFVRVDGDLCTGCGACATACPFSGIHFASFDSAPLICDLCGGEPACVATCKKPGAIRFGEVGDNRV